MWTKYKPRFLCSTFISVSVQDKITQGDTCLHLGIKSLSPPQPGCLCFSPLASSSSSYFQLSPQPLPLKVARAHLWRPNLVVLPSCLGAEQHFPEVMLGEEFLSLSLDQVCSLISSDKLTVSSEEKVLCSPLGKHEPYLNNQTNKKPFKLKKKWEACYILSPLKRQQGWRSCF